MTTQQRTRNGRINIVAKIRFNNMEPHDGPTRYDLSRALTILLADWYPEIKGRVKIELEYSRRHGTTAGLPS